MSRFAIACAFVLLACGSNSQKPDNDPYNTYQACWDDHHTTEGFDVQKSIVICCIDHPIGTMPMNVVCGNTAASCVTYVTQNLTSTEVMASDIQTACNDYITQRGM
jgi:hypothetical protein